MALLGTSLHSEEIQHYKVEMIFFTYIDMKDNLSERGPSEAQWLNLNNVIGLSLDDDESDYQILSDMNRDLNDIHSTLQRSPRYRLLKHVVWRQPGLSQALAKAVHIRGDTPITTQPIYQAPPSTIFNADRPNHATLPMLPNGHFDGTVKVVLGRYLHVYTNLLFLHYDDIQNEQGSNGKSNTPISFTYYRVKDHRRMRSRELHYLDHPLLGILVQITPIELKR